MHNFESTFRRFPTGGEGTNFRTTPPSTTFDLHSTFTQILRFMEQSQIVDMMNLKYAYNDKRYPQNQTAAKTKISAFLCPSNGYYQEDPQGYGTVDYMPTVYTDIDPVTKVRNKANRMDGALAMRVDPSSPTGWIGFRFADITDGTSHTVAISEDSGRNYETQLFLTTSKYPDPVIVAGNDADDPTPSGNRAIGRWAEPDNGNGVSGPPNAVAGSLKGYVNNNSTPQGGPSDCQWGTNNCGPNDEIYSLHPGGANAVFCDGSVRMLPEQIDGTVLRYLVTRAETKAVDSNEFTTSDVPPPTGSGT